MKIGWSRFAHLIILLTGFAAACAQAQQGDLQQGRREKFRSEQFERSSRPTPEMPRAPREMSPARPLQGAPADDGRDSELERQRERRAVLRRQINEARDIYPPPGKP